MTTEPMTRSNDVLVVVSRTWRLTVGWTERSEARAEHLPVWARGSYSLIVRMTLFSGRVLFDDSLSSCASISSYFGTVVISPFGTMCTTL
jgi:hypothetical protein